MKKSVIVLLFAVIVSSGMLSFVNKKENSNNHIAVMHACEDETMESFLAFLSVLFLLIIIHPRSNPSYDTSQHI